MNRRDFFAAGAAGTAGALIAPSLFASEPRGWRAANFAVGIQPGTQPDWSFNDGGPQRFIRAIDDVSELGYRMIESFPNRLGELMTDPQRLKDELDRRNLGLITLSGGGNFTDPAQRADVIERNLQICRFIRPLGAGHLKINVGGETPAGQVRQTPQVYREMATTLNELGRRITDMGMRFGIHAHLNTAFETRQDVDTIMEMTDPRHVWFILDTGHIAMAGMDPVQLTRDYAARIVEYHLKDVAPEHRGGSPNPIGRMLQPGRSQSPTPALDAYPGIPEEQLPASIRYRNRHFFEMGRGGVDYPAILRILEDADWSGYLTVELDWTNTTSKGSAAVNKQYLERVLGLDVERPAQRPTWNS